MATTPYTFSNWTDASTAAQQPIQDALLAAQQRRQQMEAEYQAQLLAMQQAQAAAAQPAAAPAQPTAAPAQPAQPGPWGEVSKSLFAKEFLPSRNMDVGGFAALPFEEREKLANEYINTRATSEKMDAAQRQKLEALRDKVVYADAGGREPSASILRGAGDIGLATAQGAVGAVRSIAQLAGADNAVANSLKGVNEWLQDYKSTASKQEAANIERRIELAKKSGSTAEEIGAYLAAVKDQPAEMIAQGLGSLVTLGFGKAVQLARGAQALRSGATAAQAAQAASTAGKVANVGAATAQGVGAVKGQAYETTFKEAKALGKSDEESARLASEAAEYSLANAPQQAGGAVLGAASGLFGVDRLAGLGLGQATARGLLGRTTTGALGEALPEAAAAAQAQLAANQAAIRAGVMDPSREYEGVAGSAAQEAAIGGALGGGISAVAGPRVADTTPPTVPPIPGATPAAPTTPTAPAAPDLSRVVDQTQRAVDPQVVLDEWVDTAGMDETALAQATAAVENAFTQARGGGVTREDLAAANVPLRPAPVAQAQQAASLGRVYAPSAKDVQTPAPAFLESTELAELRTLEKNTKSRTATAEEATRISELQQRQVLAGSALVDADDTTTYEMPDGTAITGKLRVTNEAPKAGAKAEPRIFIEPTDGSPSVRVMPEALGIDSKQKGWATRLTSAIAAAQNNYDALKKAPPAPLPPMGQPGSAGLAAPFENLPLLNATTGPVPSANRPDPALLRRDDTGVPDVMVAPATLDLLATPQYADTVMESLTRTASTPQKRSMATFLLDKLKRTQIINGVDIPVQVVPNLTYTDPKTGKVSRASGLYSREGGQPVIFLDQESGQTEEVIGHEVGHAVTLAYMEAPMERLNSTQQAARVDIESIYQRVMEQPWADMFEIPNIGEFITEAWNNPRMQKAMKDTPYTQGLSVWGKFKESLRGLLGINKLQMPDNQFEALLVASDALTRTGVRDSMLGGVPVGAATPAVQRGIINVDGVDRPTTNSNGQAIHPTEEGVRNFWRWFGDSKVVDDQGRPLVLYHATTADFEAFLPGGLDPLVSGPAIWMSDSGEKQPAAHNTRLRGGGFREGTRVMPVYSRIRRPLVINDRSSQEWAQAVFADGSLEFPQLIAPAWVAEITRDGEYDGIIFDGKGLGWEGEPKEIIAFASTQIKSATGNSGAFSPTNPSTVAARQRRAPPEDATPQDVTPQKQVRQIQEIIDDEAETEQEQASKSRDDFMAASLDNEKVVERGSAYLADVPNDIWVGKWFFEDGSSVEQIIRGQSSMRAWLESFRDVKDGRVVARSTVIRTAKDSGYKNVYDGVMDRLDALTPGLRIWYDRALTVMPPSTAYAAAMGWRNVKRLITSRSGALSAFGQETVEGFNRTVAQGRTQIASYGFDKATLRDMTERVAREINDVAAQGVPVDLVKEYVNAQSAVQNNALKLAKLPTDMAGRPRLDKGDFVKFSYYQDASGNAHLTNAPGRTLIEGVSAPQKFIEAFNKQHPDARVHLKQVLDHIRETNKVVLDQQLANGVIGPEDYSKLLSQDLYLPQQQLTKGKRPSGYIGRALGRTTKAESPIDQWQGVLASRLEAAYYKGAIMDLVRRLQSTPNPAIGVINSADVKPREHPDIDEDGKVVNPSKRVAVDWTKEDTITGWDGARWVSFTVADPVMLKALKPKKDQDDITAMSAVRVVLDAARMATTMLVSTPAFWVKSATWDLVSPAFFTQGSYGTDGRNLTVGESLRLTAGTYKRIIPALADSAKQSFGEAISGGMAPRAKDPMRALYLSRGGGVNLSAVHTSSDALLQSQSALSGLRGGAKRGFHTVTATGHIMSDAVRFASFRAFMEQANGGKFKNAAELQVFIESNPAVLDNAILGSKKLLGNYEDVGQQVILRSIVPFFNSASVGMTQQLPKLYGTSQGRGAMAVLAGLAFLGALSASEEDDDQDTDGFGKHLRRNSSWESLHIGDAVIPIPHEMRLAIVAGNFLAAQASSKKQDMDKMTSMLFKTVYQTLVPLPGIASSIEGRALATDFGPIGTLLLLAGKNDPWGRARVNKEATKDATNEAMGLYNFPNNADTAWAVEASKGLYESMGLNVAPTTLDMLFQLPSGGWYGLPKELEKAAADGRTSSQAVEDWVLKSYEPSKDDPYASKTRWDSEQKSVAGAGNLLQVQDYDATAKRVKELNKGLTKTMEGQADARRAGDANLWSQYERERRAKQAGADAVRKQYYERTGNANRNLLQ